jgi:hypothetical protein
MVRSMRRIPGGLRLPARAMRVLSLFSDVYDIATEAMGHGRGWGRCASCGETLGRPCVDCAADKDDDTICVDCAAKRRTDR